MARRIALVLVLALTVACGGSSKPAPVSKANACAQGPLKPGTSCRTSE